jgi:hypothetical protein
MKKFDTVMFKVFDNWHTAVIMEHVGLDVYKVKPYGSYYGMTLFVQAFQVECLEGN